jgi:hypothetical protein
VVGVKYIVTKGEEHGYINRFELPSDSFLSPGEGGGGGHHKHVICGMWGGNFICSV